MTTNQASLAVLTLVLWPAALFGQSSNMLTAQEKAQGWQLLFDGKTLKGWHSQAPPQRSARAGAPAPAQPAQPAPGQVGSAKPCVGARGDAAAVVPAGGSHWEVVDGLLTACGEPTGYLTSDQSYKNFVLSLEFKCSEDTNSGVFIRSPSRLATIPAPSLAPRRRRAISQSNRISGISIRSRRMAITS
jgi:hypothetical protein